MLENHENQEFVNELQSSVCDPQHTIVSVYLSYQESVHACDMYHKVLFLADCTASILTNMYRMNC